MFTKAMNVVNVHEYHMAHVECLLLHYTILYSVGLSGILVVSQLRIEIRGFNDAILLPGQRTKPDTLELLLLC